MEVFYSKNYFLSFQIHRAVLNKHFQKDFDIDKPVLQSFLEIRGFEIRGFSIPPTYRELPGLPVFELLFRLCSALFFI